MSGEKPIINWGRTFAINQETRFERGMIAPASRARDAPGEEEPWRSPALAAGPEDGDGPGSRAGSVRVRGAALR
ncbi:hypothetical protein GCM10009609_27270 [Pseudonocardia aurantiaca]